MQPNDRVKISTNQYQKTYSNPEQLDDEGTIVEFYPLSNTALVKMDNPNAQYKEGEEQYLDEFPLDCLTLI